MSTFRPEGSNQHLGLDPHETTAVNADKLRDVGRERQYVRVGTGSGVLGVVLLMVGTALHPVPSDGNDAPAAFAAYAEVGRPAWLAAHLLPLAGITAMLLAMVLLSQAVATTGIGRLWAKLIQVVGAAAIAVTAGLQAVDGVALKAMVDLWFRSSTADNPALFAAAQAVRQIEIGMDAVFSLTLALTTVIFALVLWETGQRSGRLLAGLAFGTAATAAVAGVLFGLQGFSAAAMNAGMGSGVLGMILTLAAGGWAWRFTRRQALTTRPLSRRSQQLRQGHHHTSTGV
jgi:hypothetical protein